jgi:hypothetical protein
MTRALHMLTGFLGGLALCLTCRGADSVNPYQRIVERNVFQLIPPPPPSPPQPAANKAPLPKIFLTGFTTLAGRRALFKVIWPAKPGEASQAKYYVIPEGGCEGQIQVQAIDEKAGTARLSFAGTQILANLKDKDLHELPAVAPASGPATELAANPAAAQPVADPQPPRAEEKPVLPAQYCPRIIPTPPAALLQAGAASDAPTGHRNGYDEHGL